MYLKVLFVKHNEKPAKYLGNLLKRSNILLNEFHPLTYFLLFSKKKIK